jgi:hypothetical protein
MIMARAFEDAVIGKLDTLVELLGQVIDILTLSTHPDGRRELWESIQEPEKEAGNE